jgi:hypothetical protein
MRELVMEMHTEAKLALSIARAIQLDLPRHESPSHHEGNPDSEQILALSVVSGTRGYIEKVANQVNGCYERGWYDSCAVMIRRLVETLIIEAFEHHGIAAKIQSAGGDFLSLEDLVNMTLQETSWNLGRDTKKSLPKLKHIGDLSAHARRYNAHKNDIEKNITGLRIVIQ